MLNNRTYLKKFRKQLRNHSTSAEASLWVLLKGKQIDRLKFRRQHSIANYIMDFYCPDLKLAIELDGEVHRYQEASDQKRDQYLSTLGIIVLRYENRLVFEYPEQIIQDIRDFKKKSSGQTGPNHPDFH